ncbi:MAG: hypothetical protein GY794_26175 [bacterium]|nr:hypothetical protein [bacterium]
MISDNDMDTAQQVKPKVSPSIHTAILGGNNLIVIVRKCAGDSEKSSGAGK